LQKVGNNSLKEVSDSELVINYNNQSLITIFRELSLMKLVEFRKNT